MFLSCGVIVSFFFTGKITHSEDTLCADVNVSNVVLQVEDASLIA